MISKERRKTERITTHHLNLNITFTEGDLKGGSQIQCRIANISLDGLRIETQYPIASGDVFLKITGSENNPDEIRGRVVYCEKISPEMFYLGVGLIGSNIDKFKFISQLMKIENELTIELDSIHKNFEKTTGIDEIKTPCRP